VLVDFLGGDPDRPVIVGRVYTNLQKTPYKLPENKTQSGLKSNSTGKTGGYNELMFEDAAGRELVRMQAEKDLHKLVKNDENVTIGRNRTKLVKNDDTFTVGNDRRKLVRHDEDVTIGNDRTKLVQNDEKITIGNDRTKTVQNDERVTVGNNRFHLVENDENVTIGNDHTRHVKSNELVTIGQDFVKMVMANTREVTGLSRNVVIGLHRSTQVGMIDSTMVGQKHVVMVSPPGEGIGWDSTSWSMESNHHDLQTTDGAKISMDSKTIIIDAGAKIIVAEVTVIPTPTVRSIVFDTGDGAKITMVGGKITMEADEISINGKKAEFKTTDGDLVIKGGPKVKINP
jgi:type VI secretion system secreted protein VgrG